MRLIKLFWKTCKVEGVRKAILRSIAQVLGVKIIGFDEKENKESKLLDKYKIPKACIQQPIFLHSSIKRAMFYEPIETQKLINTCFADILIHYVKTMNAFGMEVYQERKRILELALIISDNEKYYKHLAYAISNQWEWEGPTYELLERCKSVLKGLENKDDSYYQIYMIYISSLIEMNKTEEAKGVLSVYVDLYGKKNIHLYYPVAKLALEVGIENEKIKKAAYICEVILRNNNVLADYLEGKSIAVVGSGPGEIGKGNGREIDLHDVVIRFNDYETRGYEQDYGSKTTVWVRNIDVENGGCKARLDEIKNYDVIIIEANIWRFSIPELFLDTFYQYAQNGQEKLCMLQYRDEMIREMGSFPTSGGLMLYNIVGKKKQKNEKMKIFGFSFREEVTKELMHYHDRLYRESNLHHGLTYEREYLRGIFK